MADKTVGLLPAAGMARRMTGIEGPKELLVVEGRPVIEHSVAHLLDSGVDKIVVVIRASKEAIRHHLTDAYPEVRFVFAYQQGEIGNLLDAIKAAVPLIAGSSVRFLMPDTIVEPNPFRSSVDAEATLYCFRATGDSWRHFGVVVPDRAVIVDKPDQDVGSRICWGALDWRPEFTERLLGHATLPDALNASSWRHVVSIERYRDIGTGEDLR